MSTVCAACGVNNEDGALFCDNCGSPFPAAAAPRAPVPPLYSAPPPAAPSAPQAGSALVCPVCGHATIAGAIFCDNCGRSLAGAAPPAPVQPPIPTPPPSPLPPSFQPPAAYGPASPQPFQPAPQYPPATQIAQPPYEPPGYPAAVPSARFIIGGMQVAIPQKPEVIIGRPDHSAQPPWKPDVDLTPYGGGDPQSGVSRRHARLTWQGAWYIEDLHSVNGVFVRGQKILQRTPLSSGDQIGLGRLLLTFYSG